MIFLDHNATTPMLNVAKAAMNSLVDIPLNPSSVHGMGRAARMHVDKAREQILRMLGISGRDKSNQYNLTFTASGTEANNLILDNYCKGDIFISAIEHASIEMPAKMIPSTYVLPVKESGLLDLEFLDKALAGSNAQNKLVSVMLANNETGIIQPIKQIAQIAHKYGAQIHSDIVQAAGKIPVDMIDLDLDFASISGHKFGGALGCGALISRANFYLQPSIIGGGQERSVRSGTENVLAIAATGAAAEYCYNNLQQRIEYLNNIRQYLESSLQERHPEILIISKDSKRLANTTGLIIPGKSAELMVIALDLKGIAIGSGSACSSGRVGKSKTLQAMGFDEKSVESAIRISVGVQTTRGDIDEFLDELENIVNLG